MRSRSALKMPWLLLLLGALLLPALRPTPLAGAAMQDKVPAPAPAPEPPPYDCSAPLPLPSQLAFAKSEYELLLGRFLRSECYSKLGWPHDKELRQTGPTTAALGGKDPHLPEWVTTNLGTHGTVAIYYSEDVYRWLCERDAAHGRRFVKECTATCPECRLDAAERAQQPVRPIADGAMIVKLMFGNTTAAFLANPAIPKNPEFLALMVKDSRATRDGWKTPRSCQDCHMGTTYPGVPGALATKIASIQEASNMPQTENRLGQKDIDLQSRSPFARHTLVGLNVFFNEFAQQFPDVLGIRIQDPMLSTKGVAPLQTTYDSMVEQADHATAEVAVEGIESRNDRLVATVQIYQELVRDPRHRLTTSFLALADKVKDNRLLPSGWTPTVELARSQGLGSEKLPAEALVEEVLPKLPDGKGRQVDDPWYKPKSAGGLGGGGDEVTYSVPTQDLKAKPASVRATLYYQAIPPFYLQDRFCTTPKAPDTSRLFFVAGHVNLDSTRAEGWKLQVVSSGKVAVPLKG